MDKKAIEYLLENAKFGLTWDIGHSKAIREIDLPFIMGYSKSIRHFHIHDATTKSEFKKGENHLALGDGEIDIIERIALADKTNSRCVLETKTTEALKKSVEYLKNIKMI